MNVLLTIKEAAAYLRMNPLTVYRLASKGDIPAVKVGGNWRVHREMLETWLRSPAPKHKPAILVVDDEATIRRLFTETLGREDYQVIVMSSGEDAVRSIPFPDLDLIFLDLRMPGMDGVEVFRRIRAIDAQVPVVIMTGYPDSDLMAQALEIGPVAAMLKPFGPGEIQDAVASFCYRERGRAGTRAVSEVTR